MVRMVTSKGKSLGLCLAVCKLQASERYIQSLPVVLKDKRSRFFEGKRSAVQLPLYHVCSPEAVWKPTIGSDIIMMLFRGFSY